MTGDKFHRVVWRELNPRVVDSTIIRVSVELCEVFDEFLDERVFQVSNQALWRSLNRTHPWLEEFLRNPLRSDS